MSIETLPDAVVLDTDEAPSPKVNTSCFVRVSRALAEDYWHRPWSEVVQLATQGIDGLSIRAPGPRGRDWIRPERDAFPDDPFDPDRAARRFAAALEYFEAEHGWAYLRYLPPDTTALYQQNW